MGFNSAFKGLRMNRDLYYCAPSVPAWRVTETFTFTVSRIILSECVCGVLRTVQNSKCLERFGSVVTESFHYMGREFSLPCMS